MTNMGTYVTLLLQRYAKPHLLVGVKEVHVVFGNPGSLPKTPKELEHVRRNQGVKQPLTTSAYPLPHPLQFLKTGDQPLLAEEVDILYCIRNAQDVTIFSQNRPIICDKYCNSSIQGHNSQVAEPTLHSNADEADMRLWLHCKHSAGSKKLIFSPDTDIYIIGLTIAPTIVPPAHVFVQLNKSAAGF